MKNIKCVEYYYDSGQYTKNQLIEIFNKDNEKYFDKIVKMDIKLNQWGVYIVKLEFEKKRKYLQKKLDNMKIVQKALVRKQPSIIKKYYEKVLYIIEKIKILLTRDKRNISKLERYYKEGKNNKIQENKKKIENNYNKKQYGKYKSTGTFKPY